MKDIWLWLKWHVKNVWRRMHPVCPKCRVGRIFYLGEDWTGWVWLSLYQCDRCGEKYV